MCSLSMAYVQVLTLWPGYVSDLDHVSMDGPLEDFSGGKPRPENPH